MALSRWSHSEWYVYEPVGREQCLHISLFGTFTLGDILLRYDRIDAKAKADGAGYYDRLELWAYLRSWALWNAGKMDRKRYVRILNSVRLIGNIRYYARSPNEYNFDSIIYYLERLK